MKFMVAVDCEGVACVVGRPAEALGSSNQMEFARRQATREANAVAQALLDSGAERVVVWDNHGGGVNLEYCELDPRVDIALGVGNEHRWPGLTEGFSGVCLIGYHPMDSTADGVLAHTFSSATYQWIEINGAQAGEMEIDAAMAGRFGVPVIMVASDRKGCEEAGRFMPWIETVETKVGFGWNGCVSKHPLRVLDELAENAKKAVQSISRMEVFRFEMPAVVRIRYKRLESAQQACVHAPWKREEDPYVVKRTIQSMGEMW
ncbi:MAG TPA: M55 family metallopeptidase [Candidatus Brocadiia bacterium]|nr:M55 family metallopeptidase [Candidatus Brocadiia bacterium]